MSPFLGVFKPKKSGYDLDIEKSFYLKFKT